MMDYSMNLDEKKDFILGYDITKDGQMIVQFAKGKPWTIPYNEVNEQILLDKMKKQLNNVDAIEKKLKEKKNNCFPCFLVPFGGGLITSTFAISSEMPCDILIFSGIIGFFGILPFISFLKTNFKLNNLKKNKKFLEMEEKININIRSDKNVLTNVSNKTKKAVGYFPKDKPVFNINSFNYVPFSDLEQIMENIDRNERFGFDYTKQEHVKGKTRKKTR